MEKLREDYKAGERFYSQDMNKITHTINELEKRTDIVDELPQTGEDGVIYMSLKEKVSDQDLGGLKKDGMGNLVSAGGIILSAKTVFNIGDVIKISEEAQSEDLKVALLSINKNELTFNVFDAVGLVITGIEDYTVLQQGKCYRITDVYDVPKEKINGIPEVKYRDSAHIIIYVYEELDTEVETEYVFDNVPSWEMRIVPSYVQQEYCLALIGVEEEGDISYALSPNGEPTFFKPKIGEIVKVTENSEIIYEEDIYTGICVYSVDNPQFYEEEKITGITEASAWQKDHFYKVKETYYLAKDVESEFDIKVGMFTYEEVFNPAVVNYEVPILPGAYVTIVQKDANFYNKYIWIKDHFETFDDKTDVVTSSFVSSIWKGTQEEYDNISKKDPKVLYVIIN